MGKAWSSGAYGLVHNVSREQQPSILITDHQSFIDKWLAEYKILVPQNATMATYVPTMFCRWFQLRVTDYSNCQWSSASNADLPDFKLLFQTTEIGDPWEVRLPLGYGRMLCGNNALGYNGGSKRGRRWSIVWRWYS